MTDLNKLVDDLSALTVLEAAELAKMLEEKWGVSAAAAVAVALAVAVAGAGAPKRQQLSAHREWRIGFHGTGRISGTRSRRAAAGCVHRCSADA